MLTAPGLFVRTTFSLACHCCYTMKKSLICTHPGQTLDGNTRYLAFFVYVHRLKGGGEDVQAVRGQLLHVVL